MKENKYVLTEEIQLKRISNHGTSKITTEPVTFIISWSIWFSFTTTSNLSFYTVKSKQASQGEFFIPVHLIRSLQNSLPDMLGDCDRGTQLLNHKPPTTLNLFQGMDLIFLTEAS